MGESMEVKASSNQLQIIHAVIHKHGLLAHKADIVASFTNNRTTSSRDMTAKEAAELIASFSQKRNVDNNDVENPKTRLMSKLFAMCFEMQLIGEKTVLTPSGITKKKDYSKVHAWVLKFGYLKKPLRKYTYNELPKLVSQFEFGPYKSYIENLSI